MSLTSLAESQTRAALIDPQLAAAKWKLGDRTQVRFEVPVAGYDSTPASGITDYSLYVPSGWVLAAVEAKRTSRNPREREERATSDCGRCSGKRCARPSTSSSPYCTGRSRTPSDSAISSTTSA
jgi:type I restriction enzyme R subunit